MTQTAFATTLSYTDAPETCIFSGEDTGLFTSGSTAQGTSTLTGDAVEMFTTSCVTAGEGVEMFTTSCITPQGNDMTAGDNVALFTTSC